MTVSENMVLGKGKSFLCVGKAAYVYVSIAFASLKASLMTQLLSFKSHKTDDGCKSSLCLLIKATAL